MKTSLVAMLGIEPILKIGLTDIPHIPSVGDDYIIVGDECNTYYTIKKRAFFYKDGVCSIVIVLDGNSEKQIPK